MQLIPNLLYTFCLVHEIVNCVRFRFFHFNLLDKNEQNVLISGILIERGKIL